MKPRETIQWTRVCFWTAAFFITSIAFGPRFVCADETPVSPALRQMASTHKATGVISTVKPGEGLRLDDFCLARDGNVLALVGRVETNSPGSLLSSIAAALAGASKSAETEAKSPSPARGSEVRVFNAEGEQLTSWPAGFRGQAIGVAPDGAVLVGGDGKLARFSASGEKLREVDSPQMQFIRDNPAEFRKAAKEQLEYQKQLYADNARQIEEQLKQRKNEKAEKSPDDETFGDQALVVESSDGEQILSVIISQRKTQMAMLGHYKQMAEAVAKKTEDDVAREITEQLSTINSICANDKEVFVVCRSMVGYGYNVWRTNADFSDAREIIRDLSGCCGQLDVQCREGDLYVCENGRHRVVRYDREGKQLAAFGKRDRDGEGENFSGCCNPMNLCFAPSGELYVSESNGVVKRFAADGKYLDLAGIADIKPGCKNSAVALTDNEERLYYVDVENSRINVLTRQQAAASVK